MKLIKHIKLDSDLQNITISKNPVDCRPFPVWNGWHVHSPNASVKLDVVHRGDPTVWSPGDTPGHSKGPEWLAARDVKTTSRPREIRCSNHQAVNQKVLEGQKLVIVQFIQRVNNTTLNFTNMMVFMMFLSGHDGLTVLHASKSSAPPPRGRSDAGDVATRGGET